MTDLTDLRDHCRRMSESRAHTDRCGTWSRGWRGVGRHYPDPACRGCVTTTERALWTRLAAEVDAYLASGSEPDTTDETLWELP